MADFERLNRETREYNNRNVDRFNTSASSYGTSGYWRNYWNNKTYNSNNGQYSRNYY